MATKHNAPPAGVSYSPTLIDDLTKDHKALAHLLQLIKMSLAEMEYLVASSLLTQYRATVLKHLTKESLMLYAYLRDYFKDDTKQYALLLQVRKDMTSSHIALVEFFEKYEDLKQSQKLQATIYADFTAINDIIAQRMRTEETYLFPLYQSLQSSCPTEACG